MNKSGIILLEGWDISSAIVFDWIRRRHDIDLDSMDLTQRDKVLFGALFDDHLDQLVIWYLHKVTRRPSMSHEMDQFFGGLLVKRVANTSIIEAIDLNLNVAKFTRKVSLNTEEELTLLREKVVTLEERLRMVPTHTPPGRIEYVSDESIGLRDYLAQATLEIVDLIIERDGLKVDAL